MQSPKSIEIPSLVYVLTQEDMDTLAAYLLPESWERLQPMLVELPPDELHMLTKVKRVNWWLPRPSKSKYPGSFPLWFEMKLINLLGLDKEKADILHPFGGAAEYGHTVELNWSQRDFLAEFGIKPTYWGDAHDLTRLMKPLATGGNTGPIRIEDDSYDLVICDPPYSQEEAAKLYSVGRKLQRTKWVAEAVRVTKPGGFIALYHRLLLPNPEGCTWEYLITVSTRINHEGRLCGVFRKD